MYSIINDRLHVGRDDRQFKLNVFRALRMYHILIGCLLCIYSESTGYLHNQIHFPYINLCIILNNYLIFCYINV